MKKICVLLVMVLFLTGCSTAEEGTEQVIYESDVLKATYLGVSSGMLKVRLENKTNVEITVLPMDSSVDGTMVQFTSGTLATIQPGKIFNQAWIVGNVSENVEFSMSVLNADMGEIEKSENIKIEVGASQ